MPHTPPPAPAQSTGLLVIAWPIGDGDIAGLCERLRRVMSTSGADVVVCYVEDLPPSCRALEALARLQLTARRANGTIRVQRASTALRELLDVTGLAGVIPAATAPPLDRRTPTSAARRTAGTAAPRPGSS